MERVQILKADILQVNVLGCFSFLLEFLVKFFMFSFPLFEFVLFFEFETWSNFEDSSFTRTFLKRLRA